MDSGIEPARFEIGTPFTFDASEEKALESLAERLGTILAGKPIGWRVMTIQTVLALFKLTQGSVNRSRAGN